MPNIVAGWHRSDRLAGCREFKRRRDALLFDGIDDIIIVVEPDAGGEAVKKWMSTSAIRHRTKLLTLPKTMKDPSAMYLADPARFADNWRVAVLGAMPWALVEAEQTELEHREAWLGCSTLASQPDILTKFAEALQRRGVAGEVIVSENILYLALTSRSLAKPVSIAVKGPSSAGKSFVVETVLEFFPPSAFYALSAMSERALAYSVFHDTHDVPSWREWQGRFFRMYALPHQQFCEGDAGSEHPHPHLASLRL